MILSAVISRGCLECRCLLCKWKSVLGLPRTQRTWVPAGEAPMGHMGDSLDIRVNNVRRDYDKLSKKGFSELTWVLRMLLWKQNCQLVNVEEMTEIGSHSYNHQEIWLMQIQANHQFFHWGGLVTQSCPTLCNPMDCNPPDSPVHGILQARILEWVTISFAKESSWPRARIQVSCIAGRFFTTEPEKPQR